MPFKPSRRVTIGSGNGNKPTTNLKFAFCQIEIHIHDVMAIFKLAIGAAALIYWLKSLDANEIEE